MKVRFKGVVEKGRGCSCAGRTSQFVRSKTFILPSGMVKRFRAGSVEEVSKPDGAFLLKYKSFEEVK